MLKLILNKISQKKLNKILLVTHGMSQQLKKHFSYNFSFYLFKCKIRKNYLIKCLIKKLLNTFFYDQTNLHLIK